MNTVTQGQNSLGDFFMLPLNKTLYSTDVIMKTCYGFTDDYFIHLIKTSEEQVAVFFYSKEDSDSVAMINQAVKDFMHNLHENQMREIIYKETHVLHEEIVRKAFAPAVFLKLSV
ncbi:His-Xaa-Ser system protein HxsD [Pluralibacter gergoviae]|uniref:His-Xaa-Ser system protein HxsD n=1 Tax=Pluralibacter gergoviae TaxID=61647 RepID=UPI00065205D4|nr:His-Xaa-Ser system protein HxsD [Pluralibacter gergoviae]ELD4302393.1 His-Xaa-Ser system protein HxsD [Pluralibacter gergoviae]ELN2736078.1 His-Xaa-Ser system protein HxsD [Pluralibacter gergoviae]ELN2739623.1 His-Xaa-Ser system protein HxsD [Pluralibacter gergoviae]KMK31536.1 hypothetical protein ABW12_16730 [Pluralibacter gergoviae]